MVAPRSASRSRLVMSGAALAFLACAPERDTPTQGGAAQSSQSDVARPTEAANAASRAFFWDGTSHVAGTALGAIDAHLESDGLTLRGIDRDLDLPVRLRGVRCGEQSALVEESALASAGREATNGARLIHQLPDVEVEEWWLNRSDGLEQGFTLETNPCDEDGVMSLDVQLGDASLSQTEEGVRVSSGQGYELEYRDLSAVDATGRALAAWMEPEGSHVLLHVDTADAVWPITIDPLVRTFVTWLDDGFGTSVNATEGDQLGYDMDVTEIGGVAIAVVGSPFDEAETARDAGSVTVFKGELVTFSPTVSKRVWTPIMKLFGPTPVADEHFGASVAVVGSRVVVGAPEGLRAGVRSGRAFVFDLNINNLSSTSQELVPSTIAAGDAFGFSVALTPSWIAVGAPKRNATNAIDAGAVKAFELVNSAWTNTNELRAPSVAANDQFGYAVAADDTSLVVGAPYQDVSGGADVGTVNHFVRSGAGAWSRQGTIAGTPTSRLGTSADVKVTTASGTKTYRIACGAPGWDTAVQDSGAVRIALRVGTGAYTMTTFTGDSAGDQLGADVALASDALLYVGAPFDLIANASARGGVHAFSRSGATWSKLAAIGSKASLNGPDPANPSANVPTLGTQVAANASYYLAGVPRLTSPQPLRGGFFWGVTPNGDGSWETGTRAAVTNLNSLARASLPIRVTATDRGATALVPASGNRIVNAIFYRDQNGWRSGGTLPSVGDLAAPVLYLSGETVLAKGKVDTTDVARVLVHDSATDVWTLQATLQLTGTPSSYLLDRDTIVCISSIPPNGARLVTVYVRAGGTWTTQQSWTPPTYRSLALDGDTLVFGGTAPEIWRRTNGVWAKEAKLALPVNSTWPTGTTVSGSSMGWGVDVHDDRLVVSDTWDTSRNVPPSPVFPKQRFLEFTRSGSTWAQTGTVELGNLLLAAPGPATLEANWLLFGDAPRRVVYKRTATGWAMVQEAINCGVAALSANDLLFEGAADLEGTYPIATYGLTGEP